MKVLPPFCLFMPRTADHEPLESFRGKDQQPLYFPQVESTHSIVLDMAEFVTPPVDSDALSTILALAVNDDLDDTFDTYSSSLQLFW